MQRLQVLRLAMALGGSVLVIKILDLVGVDVGRVLDLMTLVLVMVSGLRPWKEGDARSKGDGQPGSGTDERP